MEKPTLDYFINHTTIGYLTPTEWNKIPYLKDNKGALPPFVIAVGDARRVARACDILELKDIIRLHDVGEELLGLTGRGRVDIVIGKYGDTKKIPLVIVETQMGMPATEIIMREVIANCHTKYNLEHKQIETDGIYVIRVGTAGGMNRRNGEGDVLKVGDLVNGSFSIGWGGTLIEAISGLDYSSQEQIKTFREKWTKRGCTFTEDGVFPKCSSSPKLIETINLAAKEMNVRTFEGGNFSKDSLYAEEDANIFIELRENYNVMSTEMEQMAIAKLVHDFKEVGVDLHTGLVSGVITVLPNPTTEDNADHETKKRVEEDSLKVAAKALWHIAYND